MRPLLLLLPVLLAGCGSVVTQDEIFAQSKAELSKREGWSDDAVLLIQHRPDDWHLTWLVSAGSFDYSVPPSARGIRAVSGTERELRFTRKGCLIGYSNPESHCLDGTTSVTTTTETTSFPGK